MRVAWSTTSRPSTGCSTALERRRGELAALAPADPRPRIGALVGGDAPRLPRPLARHRRLQPGLPGVHDHGRRRCRGRAPSTFPTAYEGPPGIVHGGFLAPALRLRGAAPQLRSRRRRQDDVARRALPPPDAAADRPALRGRPAASTAAASLDRAAAATTTTLLCRGRGAGRRRRPGQPARGVAPEVPPVTADDVHAGDDLPLTVPALLRARVADPRRRGLRRLRRRRAHLRRGRPPLGGARPGPAGHRRRARARPSGCCTRTAPTSSSAGSPRPASARSPCRSARSRPAPSWRPPARRRRRACSSRAGPTARTTTRRRSATAVPELDLATAPAAVRAVGAGAATWRSRRRRRRPERGRAVDVAPPGPRRRSSPPARRSTRRSSPPPRTRSRRPTGW